MQNSLFLQGKWYGSSGGSRILIPRLARTRRGPFLTLSSHITEDRRFRKTLPSPRVSAAARLRPRVSERAMGQSLSAGAPPWTSSCALRCRVPESHETITVGHLATMDYLLLLPTPSVASAAVPPWTNSWAAPLPHHGRTLRLHPCCCHAVGVEEDVWPVHRACYTDGPSTSTAAAAATGLAGRVPLPPPLEDGWFEVVPPRACYLWWAFCYWQLVDLLRATIVGATDGHHRCYHWSVDFCVRDFFRVHWDLLYI